MILEKVKIALIGAAGALFLTLLRRSLRLRIEYYSESTKIWSTTQPRIFAFWHNQQLLMSWYYLDARTSDKKLPAYALISRSKDGRLIAEAMKRLGINSVAGSSSRGGREALAQLIKLAKDCNHVAVTPDGPKGPIYKVKAGVIKLAQHSGAQIFPLSFAAEKYWSFGSWDKMILPKPFSRAIIMEGRPIRVPEDIEPASVERYASELENELNRITQAAKNLLEDQAKK